MDVISEKKLSRRALLRNSLITATVAAVPAFAQKAVTPTPAAAPAPGANPQIDDLKKALAASHAYTIDIAKAMPEEKYNFKPVPLVEIRTFGQQMVHIGDALSRIYQHFVEKKDVGIPVEAAKEKVDSKAEVIAGLEAAYKYVEDAVGRSTDAALDEPKPFFGGRQVPARQIIRTLLDHCTHHRAQTVVYLRLNGIVPPSYRA